MQEGEAHTPESLLLFFFPRGLCVGIYATNSADACQYVITQAKVNVLLVENDQQLRKILSVKAGPGAAGHVPPPGELWAPGLGVLRPPRDGDEEWVLLVYPGRPP